MAASATSKSPYDDDRCHGTKLKSQPQLPESLCNYDDCVEASYQRFDQNIAYHSTHSEEATFAHPEDECRSSQAVLLRATIDSGCTTQLPYAHNRFPTFLGQGLQSCVIFLLETPF